LQQQQQQQQYQQARNMKQPCMVAAATATGLLHEATCEQFAKLLLLLTRPYKHIQLSGTNHQHSRKEPMAATPRCR